MSQRHTTIPNHHVMHVEYGNKALLLLLLLMCRQSLDLLTQPKHW